MYEMHTINSNYVIIQVAAAIFFFFVCKFYKKWIDREIFELFSTHDTTKEAEQV